MRTYLRAFFFVETAQLSIGLMYACTLAFSYSNHIHIYRPHATAETSAGHSLISNPQRKGESTFTLTFGSSV